MYPYELRISEIKDEIKTQQPTKYCGKKQVNKP
jgi:hypothetical protein